MAKTLARVLAVPFSMSDCTPFTQAGYIGEDAQVCVERLLIAANYDVAAAEQGIICLDEIDKIAATKTAHGRDVGGEGVQQALLKIIEGTTLHIQSKQEKSAPSRSANTIDPSSSTGSPIFGGKYASSGPTTTSSSGSGPGPSSSKGETYSIRTDNILFIFTGAFIGLNKQILNRISKGSIGFGSPIRSSSSLSSENADMILSVKPGSEESKIFEKHLPFFTPAAPGEEAKYNPLDLLEPTDLQSYGMIPELVGRIPVTTALSALDEDALVRVLTEPRNSLVRQYEHMFQLSGVELRFTSGALREIARSSLGMGTGARGLRTCVERLLGEAMFEAPGKFFVFA
jgi:ATP-dependent Clp protease ATP-binding subunit ClpX